MTTDSPVGKDLFSCGWYCHAKRRNSPHFNQRPGVPIDLLVIHNISLPAEQFGTTYIDDLFLGCLDCDAHDSFDSLRDVQVSAHFVIFRDGSLQQYVSVDQRAWHAGVSSYGGVENCNDYGIGIELEGADHTAYTDRQYECLSRLTTDLMACYPISVDRIVGHEHIAPQRKTDPGPAFEWARYKRMLGA